MLNLALSDVPSYAQPNWSCHAIHGTLGLVLLKVLRYTQLYQRRRHVTPGFIRSATLCPVLS